MTAIARLSAASFDAAVGDLADLLADAVAGGSSLGFVDPFDRDTAADWWRGRASAVTDGRLTVWTARDDAGCLGTVSLAAERKANGTHRAEVVKLMVHRRARGNGLGRALLATAERAAAASGATLLMLDTESGSAAERLYTAAGWIRYGVVPGYAADPAGVARDCSFFYKRLTR